MRIQVCGTLCLALLVGGWTEATPNCPDPAESLDFPLGNVSVTDKSGFLNKVWWTGTSLGCSGGSNAAPCEEMVPPTECAEPAQTTTCHYWKLHLGQDLNGPGNDCGILVYSIGDGEVVEQYNGTDGTFGKYVLIEHEPSGGGSPFYSFYAHLSSISVDADSCVKKGDVIGAVGSTGTATGCHLHFEIRTGTFDNITGNGYTHHWCSNILEKYVNPQSFIEQYGDLPYPLPGEPSSPQPADASQLTALGICEDDRGTAIPDDNEKPQCLKWEKVDDAYHYEIYLDGSYAGRSWVPCFYPQISLQPGEHSWQVVPYNNFVGNPYSPEWDFELVNFCPAGFVSDDTRAVGAVCTPPSGEAPSVGTLDASNITSASAEFRLSVNPGGLDTDAWFEWVNDQNLSSETMRFYVGSGSTSTTYSYTQGGLSCDTDYYFRAHGENSEGADQGSTLSFRTGDCSSGGGGGGSDDLIRNGDFEDGDDYWSAYPDFYADTQYNNYNSSPGYAYLADDGDPANNLKGELFQTVSIPEGIESARLRFWYRITTDEPSGGTGSDLLIVALGDDDADRNTSTFLEILGFLTDQDANSYYEEAVFNLDDYAGDTVTVFFRGTTDGSAPTVFRIDDVSLEVTYPDGEPPTVRTLSANLIRDSSARLNLEVTPNGLDTEIWFGWDDDTNLSDDTERISVGDGTTHQDVSVTLHGLDCDTTYYFEAFAENDAGSDDGGQRSFHTDDCPGGAPEADTDPAVDITASSAVLTAEIFPNGRSTDGWFEWGTSASLGSSTPRSGIGSGTSWRNFEQTLNSLECETTYYFEAHAENSAGEDDGATHSFTTADCGSTGQDAPEVFTKPATDLSRSQVDLNLEVNPRGLPTEWWFDWGDSPDVTDTTGRFDAGAGEALVEITVVLVRNFLCDTTYYFRASAENSAGIDIGSTLSFTTLSCDATGPSTRTLAAVQISDSAATLTGEARPNGYLTQIWFDWGETESVRERLGWTYIGNGHEWVPVEATLNDLACDTTYHYRVGAESVAGESGGQLRTFRTTSCPAEVPQATTLRAEEISENSATLVGRVDYSEAGGTATFVSGSPGYLSINHETHTLPLGQTSVILETEDFNMECGRDYIFRLEAENQYGRSVGEILNLRTLACPPGEDLIFQDSFESGDFSAWSAVHPPTEPALAVTSASAYDGAFGLEIPIVPCFDPSELEVADQVVATTELFTACDLISAYNFDVLSGGDVSFLSGQRISIGSGFSVGSGAKFRASTQRPEFGPRYLEDSTPNGEAIYWAELALNSANLTSSPDAKIDLLIAYNLEGQPLFKVGLFFDQEAGQLRTRFDLRSQNHTSWVPRWGALVDSDYQVFKFIWRSSQPGEYARADLCDVRESGQSCSFQYHSLIDEVDTIRWGLVNHSGNLDGSILMDSFSSGRHDPDLF